MPSEKNVLPMTADDVTHLFRSTEKCKPDTRGNRLHALAYEVLHEALRNFTTTSPLQDPSSSAPSSSPSRPVELSTSLPKLSREGLMNRYIVAQNEVAQDIMPEMLEPYVNPGAAISINDLHGIIQSIHEAEVMYLGTRSRFKLTPEAYSFVRGFLSGRGYDEYFS